MKNWVSLWHKCNGACARMLYLTHTSLLQRSNSFCAENWVRRQEKASTEFCLMPCVMYMAPIVISLLSSHYDHFYLLFQIHASRTLVCLALGEERHMVQRTTATKIFQMFGIASLHLPESECRHLASPGCTVALLHQSGWMECIRQQVRA